MQTSQRVERRSARGRVSRVVHVAMVSAHDGILLTTAAASVEPVLAQLGDYVDRNAERSLWRGDAEEVARLRAADRTEEAINLYFARVGDRWDAEYLHQDVVEIAW